MNHWLLKSEPETFGIDHLAKAARKTTAWTGVRNYQARNLLRDEIQKGDQAFFYHSSCEVPGIVGIVEVIRAGYPDETQFDTKDDHYDADSPRDAPRWFVVDVKLVRKLKRVISLEELKAQRSLSQMQLLKRGNRLSVMSVSAREWRSILAME